MPDTLTPVSLSLLPPSAHNAFLERLRRWPYKGLQSFYRLVNLRLRLFFVVFVSLIPAMVLITFNHFEQRRHALKQVGENAILSAKLASYSFERVFDSTRQLLISLSLLKEARDDDGRLCSILLKNLLSNYPAYANLGIVNLDGTLFASALPVKPGINLQTRNYFRRTLKSRDFSLGDYQVGKITGRPSVNCGFPVFDHKGEVLRVVFAAVDLHWLNKMAQSFPLPQDAALSLFDRSGTLLARCPFPERWVGQKLPANLIQKAMLATERGTEPSSVVGVDDQPRVYGFSRLATHEDRGLFTAFGFSQQEALRTVNSLFFRNLLWLAISAVLVFFLADLTSRFFITRHVLKLVNATEKLRAGEMTARTGLSDVPGELGQLAEAVDQMAASLEKRQEEIRQMNQGLEQQVAQRTWELEDSNKQLESFSYSVSHDLRAPLRAIDGFSQILLNDHTGRLNEEGRRLLQVIVTSTRRMAQLIEDLLVFSRVGRQEIRSVEIDMRSLADAVSQEVRSHAPGAAVTFTLRDLPPARGDAALIRQVLINLVANAVKFSGKKKDAAVDISAIPGAPMNTYVVKDNGVGFDMRFSHKLFNVFQRLHGVEEFDGTGVGLALVQRVVKRHGGRVWAESEVGQGAIFYFTLPAGKAAS